jgi:hypothetical protein
MQLFCYRSANISKLIWKGREKPLFPASSTSSSIFKLYKEKQTTLLKELRACPGGNSYPNIELSCSDYGK